MVFPQLLHAGAQIRRTINGIVDDATAAQGASQAAEREQVKDGQGPTAMTADGSAVAGKGEMERKK